MRVTIYYQKFRARLFLKRVHRFFSVQWLNSWMSIVNGWNQVLWSRANHKRKPTLLGQFVPAWHLASWSDVSCNRNQSNILILRMLSIVKYFLTPSLLVCLVPETCTIKDCRIFVLLSHLVDKNFLCDTPVSNLITNWWKLGTTITSRIEFKIYFPV
jgi:hypothetical protein